MEVYTITILRVFLPFFWFWVKIFKLEDFVSILKFGLFSDL
jgi:hypothetical protein